MVCLACFLIKNVEEKSDKSLACTAYPRNGFNLILSEAFTSDTNFESIPDSEYSSHNILVKLSSMEGLKHCALWQLKYGINFSVNHLIYNLKIKQRQSCTSHTQAKI